MIVIYDIECFVNMFLVVFREWNTTNYHIYEISSRQNDTNELKKFIKQCKRMIGYNNIDYDSLMLNYFMSNINDDHALNITRKLRKFNDDIFINQDKRKYYKGLSVQQIDLFKLNHYNNLNRSASLKKIQVSMDFHNVEEYEDFESNVVDYDKVIGYCINDVNSTYDFCNILLPKIKERQAIKKETGLNCLNWPDSTLGEQLILSELEKELKISCDELKDKRVFNKITPLYELIKSDITFINSQHNRLLIDLKNKKTNDKINYEFLFNELPITIAKGGIHGSKRGVFESNDEYIVIDADVASLYPAIIINLSIYPEHIGKEFIKIFSNYYYERLSYKKRLKDKSLPIEERKKLELKVGMIKLMLNSCYGKMNSVYSALYYSDCLYKVTINGQLFILWWLEQIKSIVPDVEFIQANTDGITVRFKRKHLDLYYKACEKFTLYTNYELEYVEYKKMAIRDVS